MIGSKRKTITIFNEHRQRRAFGELFERVHAPVGPDIGAITPEKLQLRLRLS